MLSRIKLVSFFFDKLQCFEYLNDMFFKGYLVGNLLNPELNTSCIKGRLYLLKLLVEGFFCGAEVNWRFLSNWPYGSVLASYTSPAEVLWVSGTPWSVTLVREGGPIQVCIWRWRDRGLEKLTQSSYIVSPSGSKGLRRPSSGLGWLWAVWLWTILFEQQAFKTRTLTFTSSCGVRKKSELMRRMFVLIESNSWEKQCDLCG